MPASLASLSGTPVGGSVAAGGWLLLVAMAQGRCLFAFNVRDFVVLACSYPRHGGIVLAAQSSWTLPELIVALDRLLSETEAEDWIGQMRWLNDWRQ